MDYFTSDWHLGHHKIIEYNSRPFKDAEEMDATIISNINQLVGPDDTIYNLGDVLFGRDKELRLPKYLERITCKNIKVVLGNHDKRSVIERYLQVIPPEYIYDEDGKNPIMLAHYSHQVWFKSHKGVGHLYGHSHGNLPHLTGYKSFDVGVDVWNFKPLSLPQVLQEFNKRCPTGRTSAGDHHGTTID